MWWAGITCIRGKYDALNSFAEWGLTREDIDIDNDVFSLIQETGFKMMCGEGLLLRNLVKVGYYSEPMVKEEVDRMFLKLKSDGGFSCISKSKKINIQIGVQNLMYALAVLGQGNSDAVAEGWKYLYLKRDPEGGYILSKTKTVPAFKPGKKNKPNKWITLYALLTEKQTYCE